MRITDIMQHQTAAIRNTATLREAAELLVQSQASDLCVVDNNNTFMGIVSEGDLIRASMPDFNEVVATGVSHEEIMKMIVETGQKIADQTIERLIISAPFTLHPQDPVMKAAAVMLDKMIRRLPVVQDGRLCGTLSRAELVWGIMGPANTDSKPL